MEKCSYFVLAPCLGPVRMSKCCSLCGNKGHSCWNTTNHPGDAIKTAAGPGSMPVPVQDSPSLLGSTLVTTENTGLACDSEVQIPELWDCAGILYETVLS